MCLRISRVSYSSYDTRSPFWEIEVKSHLHSVWINAYYSWAFFFLNDYITTLNQKRVQQAC